MTQKITIKNLSLKISFCHLGLCISTYSLCKVMRYIRTFSKTMSGLSRKDDLVRSCAECLTSDIH